MVSVESVEAQLKRLKFNYRSWGKTEVSELPGIIMPEEVIYECVNGLYEGGFALLVATNFRVLLIDKKPLNYLTVADLRFDMINEIEYSHRLLGAQITISTGSKTLRFRSYNQQRLRKLINHVQHCMADAKHQQSKNEAGQSQNLGLINQQLQTYLVAQYQNQQEITRQLQQAQLQGLDVKPQVVQPSTELADYLLAQSLLQQPQLSAPQSSTPLPAAPAPYRPEANPDSNELRAEAINEVFARRAPSPTPAMRNDFTPGQTGLEVNAFRIAYSKLPMVLRNRKFGHSTSAKPPATSITQSVHPVIY